MINRNTLLKSSLAVSTACVLTGLVCKIMHYPQNTTLILAGVIAAIIFIVISLIEVWSSNRIKIAEKLMWTTGFLVMGGISGLLYFFLARKRVLRAQTHSVHYQD